MDVSASSAPPSLSSPASAPPPANPSALCPVCHQPVEPRFYFCPNCGKSLKEKPLSTSVGMQVWIYAFSLALPWIAYLAISYWPGVKYLRSGNEYAKQIGMIATVLLAFSTIVAFWLTIVWVQGMVQSAANSVGNLGNLGGL